MAKHSGVARARRREMSDVEGSIGMLRSGSGDQAHIFFEPNILSGPVHGVAVVELSQPSTTFGVREIVRPFWCAGRGIVMTILVQRATQGTPVTAIK